MAIEVHKEDILADLKETDPADLVRQETCWQLGPIKVCVTLQGGRLRACIYLWALQWWEVLCADLSPERPEACVEVEVPPIYPLAKARACVRVDFGRREVRVHGSACGRPPGGNWSCVRFDEVIFRW